MTRLEKVILTIILVAIPIALFIYWKHNAAILAGANATEPVKETKKEKKVRKDKEDKKDRKKSKTKDEVVSTGIAIVDKWEMPEILTEISGMVYLGSNRFACIQDELGKIFIYNTINGKVEKEVPFGNNGDFEGLALVNKTAYVLQADGKIFEVDNIDAERPKVKEYTTHLTVEQDAEGLCYDQKNNRLLVAIKGEDPNSNDYKGIYGFDLTSKKMAKEPVYKIDLNHQLFKDIEEKKPENIISPSEIALHPATGEIYLTDGKNARLLLLDASGNIKKLHQLSSSDFPQAEGLAFSQTGELFISSEGGKGKGSISKVSEE